MTEKCSATCRDGSPCGAYPVQGGDKCRMHGGTSTGPKTDGGKERSSKNAITHGVTADPFNLYDHLDDDSIEWIDGMVSSYVDLLEYAEGDPRIESVKRACIHIYQANRGDVEILKSGMSESQTIGVTEDGSPIVRDDEHHLTGTVLKRDKEARQILRTLGAYDDPESQKAESMSNLAEVLSD
jgi:hypothetical protein